MPLSKIDSDSLTAPLTVPAGSAAAPAITTTGDTNTGVFFPAADTIGFSEGGAEAMRINSSGNVGIGTSSPASKLEVSGSGTLELARFATTTDNTPSIGIYSNGSIRAKLRASSAETALLSQGALPLLLGTNDTERARIDSSGDFMVGTTNSSPGNGSGANVSGFAVNTNGTTWASRSGFEALSVNRVDTTGGVLRAASAGNQVGGISVTSSATAFNTSSDYRLKQDIAPMTGALIKVAALKPVTYKWKRDGSDGEGFIAHELAEVCPQAVTGDKDAVDADGNPVHQGIDTSFLVATLTAAIQELKAIVDAQGAEIAALKGTP